MTSRCTSVADVMAAYEQGERQFSHVWIEDADFRDRDLSGAHFSGCELFGARFEHATLRYTRFVSSDLTEASFADADLRGAQLLDTNLSRAGLRRALLLDASLSLCRVDGTDFGDCRLDGTHLSEIDLRDARLDGIVIGDTTFADVDVSPLCETTETYFAGPVYVDFRSVLRSCSHPGLKSFLVDCGIPPLVAEYTITAAEAEGDALATLMRSTFISYGGPDEAFARRLYTELRAHGVTTFFFPETARVGRRIGDEVHSRIQEHDRVILVCSRDSLDRPGVRNEIQETFDREARDGGATYLLPIMLDDYVLTGWTDPLAARVRDRVVGDFRAATEDGKAFDRAMSRLLAELRKDPG